MGWSPSIQLTNLGSRDSADELPRMAHSHTVRTRHPSSLSAVTARRSRATFPESLANQNAERVFGSVAFLHPPCICQKQPWTKMAIRLDGRTMSGAPGKSLRCSRNRYPDAKSNLRMATSGRVFLPRMPDIIRLLDSGDTTSTMVPVEDRVGIQEERLKGRVRLCSESRECPQQAASRSH